MAKRFRRTTAVILPSLMLAITAGPIFLLLWGVGRAGFELMHALCAPCEVLPNFVAIDRQTALVDIVRAIFAAFILGPFAMMFSLVTIGLPTIAIIALLAELSRRYATMSRISSWVGVGIVLGTVVGRPASHLTGDMVWPSEAWLAPACGALTGAICAAIGYRIFLSVSRPA